MNNLPTTPARSPERASVPTHHDPAPAPPPNPILVEELARLDAAMAEALARDQAQRAEKAKREARARPMGLD